MRVLHAPEGAGRDDPASDAVGVGPLGPFELTLAGCLDAPATARAAVAGWLTGQVDEPTVGDAQLLVGELVANSVRHSDTHAGATVSVRVEIRGDTLHLEVQDGGTTGSITRRSPDLHHAGGFDHTRLVEAVSRRWGVAGGAGTRVWAEIALVDDGRAGAVVPDPAAADVAADERRAAVAALTRADSARRRASAARQARDRAATEYARRSQSRVADLHATIARHHEDLAGRLRLGAADSDPDAA